MKNLADPRLMWLKGGLFFAIGSIGAVLLLVELPALKTGLLLTLTIWGFCRAYYFAFYVIEHYVDPGYRFSGLISFVRYAMRRRKASG